MSEIVYAIMIPATTKSLKTIYYKHLEVFVCEKEDKPTQRPGRHIIRKTHKFKKSTGWEEYQQVPTKPIVYLPEPENEPNFTATNVYSGTETYLTFFKLNDAKASKIILLENVKKKYHEELERIKASMKKNIPDLDDLVYDVKMKHAEMFL